MVSAIRLAAGSYAEDCLTWTSGAIRERVHHLPQDEWAVLMHDHHPDIAPIRIGWRKTEMR